MTSKGNRATKRRKVGDDLSPLVDKQLIKSLGHPLRTHVLSLLNERTASPSELSEELGQDLSRVAYHVKVLLENDAIELVRTEPRRGAVEHYYRGIRRSLIPPEAWATLQPDIQDGIAGGILREVFDDSSAALEAGNFGARPESHASWTPLVLDEEGFGELASLLEETLERVFDLQATATERMVNKKKFTGESVVATVSLLGFESTRSLEKRMKAQVTKR